MRSLGCLGRLDRLGVSLWGRHGIRSQGHALIVLHGRRVLGSDLGLGWGLLRARLGAMLDHDALHGAVDFAGEPSACCVGLRDQFADHGLVRGLTNRQTFGRQRR